MPVGRTMVGMQEAGLWYAGGRTMVGMQESRTMVCRGEFLDKDPHLSQSKRLAYNTLQK